MSISREECGVCGGSGKYDHENDMSNESNMTFMAELDYVHWDCYDEGVSLQLHIQKDTRGE